MIELDRELVSEYLKNLFFGVNIIMKIEQSNLMRYQRVTRKLSAIILLGMSLSAFGATDKLTVRAGQTGYLGELYPSVKIFNNDRHPQKTMYPSDPNVNYPMLPKTNDYIKFLTTNGGAFAEYNSAYGIKLVNENDNSRIIVLLFNGTVTTRYKEYNGNNVTKTAVLQKSKQISGNLVPSGILTWALENNSINRPNYFYPNAKRNDGLNQVSISSLSAYASSVSGGNASVVKGKYKLLPGESIAFGYKDDLYGNNSGWSFLFPYFLDNDSLSVEALDSCTVAPLSSTDIKFGNQLAGRKQNQLLETKLASIHVNCVTAGKLLMVVSANQQLHGQTGSGNNSGTNLAGMALDSLSGNTADSTERPYIVTSRAASTPDICRNGNGDAIPYYDRIKLGNMSNSSTKETLYFNLCHNGNIKAGSYRGSIDVSFFLE
ncbi:MULTISPECIES: hypothetical protein [Providencia]|uniref:hypothetical protein n=1 Tax=Providencia TaxID=586 RepID=UPI000EE3C90D|nr:MULTISPECIES: hypothetical protein [Providencia]HCI97595.1 hypothetical protein [Providencia sp.]EJD6082582.1 hypothetical protein [Providencia rettgeri]EJD6084154.1 hypothetical protein [Providencia rettgeri]EJD6600827.1 hypothetical protein [Providencia rettgeri]EJD6613700.1 hypothetical protein [Providencia rettgeri]